MSSINEMVERMPLEIKNKILTYRQAHPLTAVIRQAQLLMEEAIDVEIMELNSEEDLTYRSFTELTTWAEGTGCFKTLLWIKSNDGDEDDGDWREYCDRVRQDYQQIYEEYGVDGIWDDEMEERLELNKQKKKADEALANLAGHIFKILYNVE